MAGDVALNVALQKAAIQRGLRYKYLESASTALGSRSQLFVADLLPTSYVNSEAVRLEIYGRSPGAAAKRT